MKFNLAQLIDRSLGLSGDRTSPRTYQINQAIEAARNLDKDLKYARSVAEKDAMRERAARRIGSLCCAEHDRLRLAIKATVITFREEYEVWTGCAANPAMPPQAVRGDDLKARAFKSGGVATALLEVAAGAAILQSLEYRWIVAVFVSALLTALLVKLADAAILAMADRENPRETRDLILDRVMKPALWIVGICLAPVLLLRVVSDLALYELLSPLITLGMFGITLGLIPLSAALKTIGDLQAWGLRLEASYSRLMEEWRQTEIISRKYQSSAPQDGPRRFPGTNGRMGGVLMIVLGTSLLTSACNSPAGVKQAAAPPASTAPPSVVLPADLIFEMDRSGSIEPAAVATALRTLREQLPSIIEAAHATRLIVNGFASDGFTVTETRSVVLPQLAAIRREDLKPCAEKGGELNSLPHIKRMRQQACDKAVAEAEAQANNAHRTALRRALEAFGREALIPAAAPVKSRCTDLLGTLWRIATKQEGRRQIHIIVSDGYATCKQKQPIPAPSGDVKTLLLLTPARMDEARGLSSAGQYFSRREALKKAASWLEIVPGDQDNLAAILRRMKTAAE